MFFFASILNLPTPLMTTHSLRTNTYGVPIELNDIYAGIRNNGGIYFSTLPKEIVTYLLDFCSARSLCFLADASIAFKKLIQKEQLLQKVMKYLFRIFGER